MHIEQDRDTMAALYRVVASYEDFTLTVVWRFAQIFTSIALALAVVNGRLDWRNGVKLAFLDETFQTKRWGEDPEAANRLRAIRREVEQTAHFLTLCNG